MTVFDLNNADDLLEHTELQDNHGLPAGAWGREVRINMSGCDYDVISNAEAVAEILRNLVNEIGMRPFGEPLTFTFGQGALYGNTGIQVGVEVKHEGTNSQTHQLIETSNITLHANHTVPEHTAFINVFSCAEFNVPAAIAFVVTALRAKKHTFDNTLRIAPPLEN